MFDRIVTCYFSPTGGTKKIAEFFSQEIKRFTKGSRITCGSIDFTVPENRKKKYEFGKKDLLIIASPVYAGRLPNKILPDFNDCFAGNGAKAVAICAFGNRSYGGGLTELRLIMQNNGFDMAGAAAVVSQHPFSELVGRGRPDEDDFKKLSVFAEEVFKNITARKSVNLPEDTEIPPYYIPLKLDLTPAKFLKAKPATIESGCDNCGICAGACPMSSIEPEDCTRVTGICIKCQACVKVCPNGAKYFDDPDFLSHVKMLEQNYIEPKMNCFIV